MTHLKIRALFLWITIYFFGMPTREANAQTSHFEKHHAAKAHWKLKTDPILRTTHIEFYDEQNQLRYQETLSGRYVNLTPRNIRRFDAILEQVINRQLVLSHLKTDPLPLFGPSHTTPAPDTLSEPMLEANVHITAGGKLRIAYVNLARHRIQIELLDERKQVLYQLKTTQPHFAQYLDLSQLAVGQYTVSLQTQWQHLVYPVQIRTKTHYELQPGGPEIVSR